MTDLTPLDLLVKRNMLLYPNVCQSRIAVLCHLYLVLGNGYEWTADGQLSDRDTEAAAQPMPTSMVYSDLQPSDYEERFRALGIAEPILADMVEREAVDRAYQRALREVRERYIDHLASKVDHFAKVSLGYYVNPRHIIDNINAGYGLAKMPSGVEPSFRDGAIEVIHAVITSHQGQDMDREIALLRVLTDQIKAGKVTGFAYASDGQPDWEYRQAVRIIEEAGFTLTEQDGVLVSSVREIKPAEHYTVVKALRMHGLTGAEFSNRFKGGGTTVDISYRDNQLGFTVTKAGV